MYVLVCSMLFKSCSLRAAGPLQPARFAGCDALCSRNEKATIIIIEGGPCMNTRFVGFWVGEAGVLNSCLSRLLRFCLVLSVADESLKELHGPLRLPDLIQGVRGALRAEDADMREFEDGR